MGWGATIGVVCLTAAAGAAAAFGLANFLIYWQEITSREGAAGYFAVFVTATGLFGGLVVGLITALVVRSGFWKVQGYALAIVLALTVLATVLTLVLDDNGPTLDGDKVVLEVELKCPRGWKPDNAAKSGNGSFCWLQEQAIDADLRANPILRGGLILKETPESDGQWVLTSATSLTKTRKPWFLRVFVGNLTDVTMQVPLPKRPGREYKQWSQWSTVGFLPQKDKPAAADYAFRFRVQGETEYNKAHPDPAIAIEEARKKALSDVPADAPLVQWLPFFEREKGKPSYYSTGVYPELEALKARLDELPPLLLSHDRDVARRAVFAAVALYKTPASLVEPLADAGRLSLELIKEARAAAAADDPDLAAEDRVWTYFFYCDMALEQAGAAGEKRRRALLEEIAHEAGARKNSPLGGLNLIAEHARKTLEKLDAR